MWNRNFQKDYFIKEFERKFYKTLHIGKICHKMVVRNDFLKYSVVSIKRTGSLNYFEGFYHPDCFFHVLLNEIFYHPDLFFMY